MTFLRRLWVAAFSTSAVLLGVGALRSRGVGTVFFPVPHGVAGVFWMIVALFGEYPALVLALAIPLLAAIVTGGWGLRRLWQLTTRRAAG